MTTTTVVEPQPSGWLRISPYTRPVRPSVNVTNPGQSGRLATGAFDSATSRSVTMRANTPIGRFTKKIHRHESQLVSAPPSTGPMATAMPVTAPNTPNATPRSRGGNASASSASDVANMIAPPMPWNARESVRNVGSPASPHSADPIVNTTIPTANTSRRPARSAIDPEVRRKAASVSAYASMTHWRSASEAWNACWMYGSATLTIVMSSSSMNTPVQTASRVHHLRSIELPPIPERALRITYILSMQSGIEDRL